MDLGETQKNHEGESIIMTLVHNLLEEHAKEAPDAKALVNGDHTFSYSSLDNMACNVAQWLISKGIKKGDAILIHGENSSEMVASLFGILKSGGIAVPINPNASQEKVDFIMKDSKPSAIIADSIQMNVHYSKVMCTLPNLIISSDSDDSVGKNKFSLIEEFSSNSESISERSISNEDVALIMYTSGSTKTPRGVVCPHKQIIFSVTAINSILKNSSKDVILCGLPLSFDYGIYQIFLAFQVGGLLILEKNFNFIPGIPRLLIQHKVTGFPGVPTLFALLLRSRMLERTSFPELRYITSTGDVFPSAHIKKLHSLLSPTLIFSMYGLTECKRVSVMPPELLLKFPSSVGYTLPETSVSIVDEHGVEVSTGLKGELIVRGSHIMKGYLNNPTDTKQKFYFDTRYQEHILYTGDIFTMDRRGLLYFIERKDDFIKSRGKKVSPTQIESVLSGIEGVSEVGVVGVPDSIRGEAIWAFLSVSADAFADEKGIVDNCNQALSPEYSIDRFLIWNEPLPLNENNKICHSDLRKEAIDLMEKERNE